MSLSCLNHVTNGIRPNLVKEVRCANDLFTNDGKLKKCPITKRPSIKRPNIKRPTTIRLSTGKIVERHGFVCPDCLNRFSDTEGLLTHYEAEHATGFFPVLKRYVRNLPLAVKIGTIITLPLGGLAGSGIVLGGNEIVRLIKKRKNQ